jgi:transcriptional regulator with XRE-family HTH domain
MDAVDLLKKTMLRKNLTQGGLAVLLGVDRVQITRYLAGERLPSAIGCLHLVALSETDAERKFWLAASGLTHDEVTRLSFALETTPPTALDGTEQQLIAWWRNKKLDSVQQVARKLIEEFLKTRTL